MYSGGEGTKIGFNHISSRFLIPLSDSSLICTVPAQWLVILDAIIVIKVKDKRYSSSWQVISQIRGVTCHMGSHSVTLHPTQVNTHHLNPSQTGRYSIYLPRRDGRLSWPRWLVTYRDVCLPVDSHPSKYYLGPVSINFVDQTNAANHYTKPPPLI